MAYQITLTNGNILTTLSDDTLDTTTSLTLVGRAYAGYGQIIADDLVRLLENSANSSAPAHPLVGQVWFNTTTSLLNVWTGTTWFTLSTGVSSVLGNSGAITLSELTAGGVAPLISPALTGIPTAPTAPANTATTQLATTAFVSGSVSSLITGVSSVLGNTGAVTLAELVNGGLAPLSSPILTGTPTAPTPATGTNNTQVATTAFVISQVGALSSGVSSVLGFSGAVSQANLITGGMAPSLNTALTGIPTAPTAAVGTNTGQLASTAFVQASQASLLALNNTWTGTDTFAGGLILPNALYLTAKDTGGALRSVIGLDASNKTIIFAGTSSAADTFRIVNAANTLELMTIGPTGGAIFGGSVSANGMDPAGGGQLRANGGSYGLIIRNDDTDSYLLLTNPSNPTGAFNSLRPLTINNASGFVLLDGTGAGVQTGGQLNAGAQIFSNGNITAQNGRLRASFGAINSGDANAAVLAGDFQFSGAGYLILPSSPASWIIQWGSTNTSPSYTATFNFPIAFPNACLNIVVSGTQTSFMTVTVINNAQFTLTFSSDDPNILSNYIAIGY